MAWPNLPLATTISLIALMVSLGTTFVTYIRTYKQDIHDRRKELRELLEKLIAIPRESMEKNKQYEGNRGMQFGFDQIFNQETMLLSRQAAEIAQSLPKRLVSATEYLTIALALMRAYKLEEARALLGEAMERATDFNDRIAVLRTEANMDFNVGDAKGGRKKYEQSLAIFKDNPQYANDSYTQTSTHILTELQWATSEANAGEMRLAMQHVDQAQALAESLPFGPQTDGWKMQVSQNRGFLLNNRPPPVGAPPQTAGGGMHPEQGTTAEQGGAVKAGGSGGERAGSGSSAG